MNPVAAADDPAHRDHDLSCPYCYAMELDRLALMLQDGVLREMACRLSSERYAPSALSTALHVPEKEILRRIDVLREWGVIRMVSGESGRAVVEAVPGKGEKTLKRWNAKYCAVGGTCDTGEPTS